LHAFTREQTLFGFGIFNRGPLLVFFTNNQIFFKRYPSSILQNPDRYLIFDRLPAPIGLQLSPMAIDAYIYGKITDRLWI
jgi:hypothetical protein